MSREAGDVAHDIQRTVEKLNKLLTEASTPERSVTITMSIKGGFVDAQSPVGQRMNWSPWAESPLQVSLDLIVVE